MKKMIPAVVLLSMLSGPLMAAEATKSKPLLNKSKMAVGVGIANNSIGSNDETGFQFFAAYDLDQVNLMDNVNTSIEFGYMDYGDFAGGNSGGLWVTGVVDGNITGNLDWLGRLGLDLGDDDGFMFGAGVGYNLNKKMQLRGEYVIRDSIDSLQINLYYHL